MIIVPQVSLTSKSLLFSEGDVISIARAFAAEGARAMQFRDVDGRLASTSAGIGTLRKIAAAIDVPCQFDGPVRDPSAIERMASAGFASVVVGQGALFDPLALRWATDVLGDRLVVELLGDSHHLFDAPRNAGHVELVEAARRLAFQGVKRVLYRDITGVRLPLDVIAGLGEQAGVKVSFIGPVRSLDDIRELAGAGIDNLESVVIGEPLYDGRIRLADANRIATA